MTCLLLLGLEDEVDRPVNAVLAVDIDDLLVVVGSLVELDPGIERQAVAAEEDPNATDPRLERERALGPALDGLRKIQALARRSVGAFRDDRGKDRELGLGFVAD